MKIRFPSITRVCTERKLKKVLYKLKPKKVLYVVVLTNEYRDIIPHKKFVTVDIEPALKPDIISDIHNLNIKSSAFDTVIATQVLEHCYDPRKAINEMYRVLKKDGVMVISVPFMFHYHASPKDYYRFTKDSLRELTQKFNKVEIISIGNKFLTLWQIMSIGKFIHETHIRKIFHLFNPILKYLDFVEDTTFALGYIVIAKK